VEDASVFLTEAVGLSAIAKTETVGDDDDEEEEEEEDTGDDDHDDE
jgi:hypothetical protein